jgi:His/Glu/Gln/Arg/opine family amino acid ABC transporter permease subunit
MENYLISLLKGTEITLALAFAALPLCLILGILGACGELSKHAVIRKITFAITSTLRGLPELLVIFGVYFGGTILLNKLSIQHNLSPFVAGAIALGIVFAAYCAQAFRGAFLAIPKGQREAAIALGLTRWRVFHLILLPQAIRHALPALSNLWAVLLKDTSLVSLIGLADLLNNAKVAASVTYKPFFFYLGAALIYFAAVTVFQGIFNKISEHFNKFEGMSWN